ncbi:hypothetical protein HMPREF9413_4069 [Paenibacillus sp. HGF7]|nr:hypothetical protein HMPREF9413_4069 [Paenibacillus sp. HGF7]
MFDMNSPGKTKTGKGPLSRLPVILFNRFPIRGCCKLF